MNLTGDLKTCVEQLDKAIDEIAPNFTFRYGDYGHSIEKVRLSLDDFLQLTLMRPTQTLSFGQEINDQKHKWWSTENDRRLAEALRNAFWWPGVDGHWHFQCFEVKTEENGINDIYLLARIGSIEILSMDDPQVGDEIYWIGVKTKRCYRDEG